MTTTVNSTKLRPHRYVPCLRCNAEKRFFHVCNLSKDGGAWEEVWECDTCGYRLAPVKPEPSVEIAVPHIHLNGTGAETLMDQVFDSIRAIGAATAALSAGAPHARDYYTQKKGTWERAQEQHQQRLMKLNEVRQELEEILTHIDRQANSI